MTNVRILQPAKSAMQSGSGASKWMIELIEEEGARSIDKIMGWTSSKDMSNEIRLEFSNLGAAIDFAEQKGWIFEVIEPSKRSHIKKSYADNFK